MMAYDDDVQRTNEVRLAWVPGVSPGADLVSGYADNGDEGVVGYDGRLDIRPAYQCEFIYKDKQREAVVDSVMHGFPLNVMYWAKRGDGTFKVMDGQQRTISLCQ